MGARLPGRPLLGRRIRRSAEHTAPHAGESTTRIGVRPTTTVAGIPPGNSAQSPVPPESVAILRAAARCDGMIESIETDDGLVVIAGDQTFGEPGNPRSHAKIRDRLERLVAAGCVERASESSLRITRQGFAYLDRVEPAKASDDGYPSFQFEPIRIVGLIANEVGTPRNDGTRGSALYAVPFQLSRRPTPSWADHFVQTWNNPPSYSTRHRPRIARVEGDRIILDGTTVEELAEVHRSTLRVVVARVNQDIEEWERTQHRAAEEEAGAATRCDAQASGHGGRKTYQLRLTNGRVSPGF